MNAGATVLGLGADRTSLSSPPKDVRAIVDELVERGRLSRPQLVVSCAGGVARLEGRRGGICLRVDPALLEAPTAVQRGVLAHEIAHLALEHRQRARRRAAVLVGLLGAVGVLGLAVGTTAPQRIQLALVAAGTVFLAGRPLVARGSRRDELAADRYAVELLGERDAALRALAWQRQRGGPEDDWWCARHAATHPSLAERTAALSAEGYSKR